MEVNHYYTYGVGPTNDNKLVDNNSIPCVAYDEFFKDKRYYYVKVDVHGNFFNFNTGNDLDHLVKFDNDRGKYKWEFERTNEVSYELYVKYLRTGNNNYKQQAERLHRHG